ncbi:MAG TPA: helix-turn-helix domain-containing protein [Vicinamibacterales bacterium]|nr:helix-turn-helix domain-containing protein [Vicinamibacterales bacterium]
MEAQRDFGERIKRLREQRGITLREIADTTKLSMRALEALERNDISRLPGGIYSRGLVRAYAEQIGLDPEATVQEFITRFPEASLTDGSQHVRAEEVNTDPPSMVARRLMMAAAILVPIALIIGLSMLVRLAGW